MCNDGFRNVGGQCQKLPAVTNGRYIGSTLMCNDGFKNVGSKCLKMTVEEYRNYLLQLQIAAASQRNSTFYIDGEEFTLKDIANRCEVWKWSDNYGDLECRGSKYRIIERKCEAYFWDKDDKTGEVDCRGSDMRTIERQCTVEMYSESYGDVSC